MESQSHAYPSLTDVTDRYLETIGCIEDVSITVPVSRIEYEIKTSVKSW